MKWPINLNKHCSVRKHADEFSNFSVNIMTGCRWLLRYWQSTKEQIVKYFTNLMMLFVVIRESKAWKSFIHHRGQVQRYRKTSRGCNGCCTQDTQHLQTRPLKTHNTWHRYAFKPIWQSCTGFLLYQASKPYTTDFSGIKITESISAPIQWCSCRLLAAFFVK